MSGQIRTQNDGQIGWLVFDHPERRNAVSINMWREIPGAVQRLAADEDVRVVIMRGAGESAFISGADISEFESRRTGDATHDYDAAGAMAIAALLNLDKPLIALIHGFCVGGGVAISLTADLRYASEDAVFSAPAARLGLGYSLAAFEMLTNLVGPSAAKEIFFTARRYRADEVLRLGLIDAAVPRDRLEALVRETAERIASNAPLTIRSVKLMLRELAREPGDRDLEAISVSTRACFESDDYQEGVRAFLEKRPPRFRGH